MPVKEPFRTHRIGWLRAAVLGANDGIVSTASLVIGVSAADSSRSGILLAGIAGLAAGAMSMASGEYVSVSSQSDTEQADLERERRALAADPEAGVNELVAIYKQRGLDEPLARQVAQRFTNHDALAAHARDELGISESQRARPIQAAIVSALTFAIGALMPVLTAAAVPLHLLIPVVAAMTLVFLGVLGGVGAYAGGAPLFRATLRVMLWGALAMTLTALIGRLFGTVV